MKNSKKIVNTFRCFNDIIEYLLYSDDVFCTTDYLLHPHFNNLAMPPYFDSLYSLIFSLEQVCVKYGLDRAGNDENYTNDI